MIAATPVPPYWAVIFTSLKSGDHEGYEQTGDEMLALASGQPGFLGYESAGDGALGITVSYWRSPEDIAAWKANADHVAAQKAGRARWYRGYATRVAKVERAYGFGEQR